MELTQTQKIDFQIHMYQSTKWIEKGLIHDRDVVQLVEYVPN